MSRGIKAWAPGVKDITQDYMCYLHGKQTSRPNDDFKDVFQGLDGLEQGVCVSLLISMIYIVFQDYNQFAAKYKQKQIFL